MKISGRNRQIYMEFSGCDRQFGLCEGVAAYSFTSGSVL